MSYVHLSGLLFFYLSLHFHFMISYSPDEQWVLIWAIFSPWPSPPPFHAAWMSHECLSRLVLYFTPLPFVYAPLTSQVVQTSCMCLSGVFFTLALHLHHPCHFMQPGWVMVLVWVICFTSPFAYTSQPAQTSYVCSSGLFLLFYLGLHPHRHHHFSACLGYLYLDLCLYGRLYLPCHP